MSMPLTETLLIDAGGGVVVDAHVVLAAALSVTVQRGNAVGSVDAQALQVEAGDTWCHVDHEYCGWELSVSVSLSSPEAGGWMHRGGPSALDRHVVVGRRDVQLIGVGARLDLDGAADVRWRPAPVNAR